MKMTKTLSVLMTGLMACAAQATDYYVSTEGNDANDGLSPETAVQTLDKAFELGGGTAGNNIYVQPGEYVTDRQWGFDLQANLIGDAESRDQVVIRSAGNYRTLRMNAAGPTVTNLTIVGESTQKADKGGAIEMNGGTLVDCVIRDGSVKNSSGNMEGGNLYVGGDDALVLNCEILGGRATKRGGNVYLDKGTMRGCTVYGGTCANVGGNVYQYAGRIEACTIYGGVATNDGGNVRMNGPGTMSDSFIYGGTVTANEKKGANVYMDSSAKMSRCHLRGGANPNYDAGSLCVYSTSASVEDTLVEGSSCGGVLLGAPSYLYNMTIVNNQKYGVWSWSHTQHLYNCIIFGNTGDDGTTRKEWSGNSPDASDAHFLNCATSEDSMSQTAYPTLVYVAEGDFADYGAGDYRPAAGGALVDAGAADPRGAEASSTDLDGNPRLSAAVDIGCYEYQKPELTVRIVSVAYSSIWAPSTVTFTHATENSASPENMVFTYDFGDGSANETTAALTIDHAYVRPGVYTVRITATNAQEGEVSEMVYEGYVRVASSTVYVQPGNVGAAFPYDTPGTGYASLAAAVGAAYDGYTLYLGEGTYESAEQISVTKALTIVGMGETPEAVVLRNTAETPDTYYHRTIELNNAGASLANVTVENGKVKNQYGGNLRIAGGACVSNCVIRGGLALADGGNAAGAGVVLGGSNSTITHCVISNNIVQGTSNDKNYAGGAIFVEYNAKYIHLSNLLVAGNRYVSTDATKSGTAGVRYGGANDWTTMENCTIVDNEVEGVLPEDSAAVYCTSWHVCFINNIFVGNRETQKDGGKYTSVKFDFNGASNYKYMSNVTDDVLINSSANKSVGNKVASATSLFKDFARGDFTIKPGCAAYNAGTTTGLALKPSVDLAGNPRIFDSLGKERIDMGCYECQKTLGFAIIIR